MFCRLCLHKSENEIFTTIFTNVDELNWQHLISQHLNLKIKENDAHSKVICLTCSKKLKEVHEFYELVQNRQTLLLEIEANLQASTKSAFATTTPSTSEYAPRNIKSEICETECFSEISMTHFERSDNFLLEENNKTERSIEGSKDFAEFSISDSELPTGSVNSNKTVKKDLDQRTCAVCKKILISSVALKTHINDFHMKPFGQKTISSKRKYETIEEDASKNKRNTYFRDDTADRTCILCNKTFKRMSTLLAHMKRFHTGVHPFECITCGVKFLTHRGLDSHFQIEKNCAKANRKLELNPNRQELNFAKQLDTTNVAYRTCGVCKTLFENWKYLEKHMQIKHKGIPPFLCLTCGKAFLLKLHFHNHLKSSSTCIKATKVKFNEM